MNIDEIIIYEDNHLIVLNKPAGSLSQGDSSDRIALNEEVKEFIKRRDSKPGNVFIGIVHRLDLYVSGVLIYAKTSKGAARLSDQIRKRKVSKFYICMTERSEVTVADETWHNHTHMYTRKGNKTYVTGPRDKSAQQGELLFTTLITTEKHALHLVKLITGRKHQIRATFCELGIPILGDRLYGSRHSYPQMILLHSLMAKCLHPTIKDERVFTATIPAEFISLLGDVRKDTHSLISNCIDNCP
ncbi:MAG: RNA pseudouridine synthase [Spirochaetes bacterium]|jgi:23S rRNA pseudouridine1911/1915/1917 synthase|nr:RNA pseudouridine synthase [Spirochaetota bacterium]